MSNTQNKRWLRTTLMFSILFIYSHVAKGQSRPVIIKPMGVKINVNDIKTALDFYVNKLGFHVEKQVVDEVILTGSTKESIIVLKKVTNLLPGNIKDAGASLTLQINDIDSTITRLKGGGVSFGPYIKRKEGVGYAIYCDDPFGTKISLMHETIVKNAHFEEPKIYNYGFYITDMDIMRQFYLKIGFKERSQNYLPYDMPLNNADGTFAFMLHYRDGLEMIGYHSSDYEHIVILFKTNNIQAAKAEYPYMNFLPESRDDGILGKIIGFRDPMNYISEIVEVKE